MKKKLLTAVFLLSWLAVFPIAGSLDQNIISCEQAAVMCVVTFSALGISGFLSGLLTAPKPQKQSILKHRKNKY